MSLAWRPLNFEAVHGHLFAHSLEPRARQIKEIFEEYTLQRAVISDHATVYQAELEAIYQACKYMDDNYDTLKPKYVKILTDSQSALKALDSIDFKSTMALKTAEALENLKWRTKGCTIAWVKAHIGTPGNEAADSAARQGAENPKNKHTYTRKNSKTENRQCNKKRMEMQMAKCTPLQAH